MNIKQRLIKLIYPLLAKVSRKKGVNMNFNTNENKVKPLASFYSLSAIENNGKMIDFNEFKNKKVLIVNTASECGYTPQFDDLQKLQEQFKNKLTIIGFPSNDFGEQEQGNDEQIASFCKINYGVTFTLAKKSHVKDAEQNEVFKWLSDKNKNGWNGQQPQWNFCKYLVDENGMLLGYYAAGVQPFDKEIADAL
ncbi:MAG TPA: glutathione peroxidase [Puia sp.]|jgi:glutathione peroxidase|nr:glutathione peroxidase [Puia sp.]